MWKRLIIISQAVVVVGSAVQILLSMREDQLTKPRIAECVLSWSLPINGGFLEIVAFFGLIFRQILRRRENTERMGVPANRLQSEIAVAHLAFGMLGLLSFWFRRMFWFATIVGHGTFLVGVAIVNAREMLKQKVFLFDILVSLVHIALLRTYMPLEAQPQRKWQRVYRRFVSR